MNANNVGSSGNSVFRSIKQPSNSFPETLPVFIPTSNGRVIVSLCSHISVPPVVLSFFLTFHISFFHHVLSVGRVSFPLSIQVSLLGTDFRFPLLQNSLLSRRVVLPHGEFTVEGSCLSAAEKFILIEVPEKSETSQENSSKTIYYPALLGSVNGPGTDSSSASLPPNFGELNMIHINV